MAVQLSPAFTCAACGTAQDVVAAIRPTEKTAPFAAYAVQGYAPSKQSTGAYSGKFYAPFGKQFAKQYSAAASEWENLKETELRDFLASLGDS